MNDTLKIMGKIIKILPEQKLGNSIKKTFLLETPGEYPTTIPFDMWQSEKGGKIDLADGKEGQDVMVGFGVASSEWKDSHITNLKALFVSEPGNEEANNLKFEGSIKNVSEVMEFSKSSKRNVLMDVPITSEYSAVVEIELSKTAKRDNIDKITEANIGDRATVSFNIRTNEHNGKYFVNLDAWRVEGLSTGKEAAPVASGGGDTEPSFEDSDLPF